MKKNISIILTAVLFTALTACGSSAQAGTTSTQAVTEAQKAAAESTTAAKTETAAAETTQKAEPESTAAAPAALPQGRVRFRPGCRPGGGSPLSAGVPVRAYLPDAR